MEKIMIDERTGWEYELIGEQYYPTGRIMRDGRPHPEAVDADYEPEEENSPEEETPVGVWTQQHLRYIKQYRKNLYYELYVSGRLNGYLAEIEAQAEDMFFQVVKEMSAREDLTEAPKAEEQMLWVQRSSNIHNRAREIVHAELIYV